MQNWTLTNEYSTHHSNNNFFCHHCGQIMCCLCLNYHICWTWVRTTGANFCDITISCWSKTSGIDHPENQFTELYKDEYQENLEKLGKKQLYQEKPRRKLEDLTKTHKNILFLNKNYQKPSLCNNSSQNSLKNINFR